MALIATVKQTKQAAKFTPLKLILRRQRYGLILKCGLKMKTGNFAIMPKWTYQKEIKCNLVNKPPRLGFMPGRVSFAARYLHGIQDKNGIQARHGRGSYIIIPARLLYRALLLYAL